MNEIKSNIMDTRGLILNTAYNDFILDSNISNYLYKNHTKRFYNESTFTNSSYYFYDDEIDIWCDDDGNINTIRCASSCLYQGVELIGLPFQELLSAIHILPSNYEQIYLLVNGRGQNQHVYDFETIGLQIWVWRQKVKTVLIYKVVEEE